MLNVNIFRLNMYTADIRAVIANLSKFPDDMKCAICGDKHTFDKGSISNDIPYLRKHFFAYCLQWKQTQKQMTTITAVNKVQAATLDACGDDDHDIVSDNSNTTTDNDDDVQDFCTEGG